jgi:hypothetical protein
MRFLKTLDADRVQNIWAKFDVFLIEEFRKANEAMSEADIDEAIKDGKLTIQYQESLEVEGLSEEEKDAKLKESDEYLVEKFGTVADVEALEAWKAAN